MEKYRLRVKFTSGNELSITVDFNELKEWVKKEEYGYRIVACNGYYWR